MTVIVLYNDTVSNCSVKGEGFMEMLSIEKELKENAYPGRGIIIGKSADGTKAVTLLWEEARTAVTVFL